MLTQNNKERVVARIAPHVYETITRAVQISGSTINQFIAQSAYEKAQKVIKDEKMIQLSLEDAEFFFNSIDNPPEPNKKMKRTVKAHKERA